VKYSSKVLFSFLIYLNSQVTFLKYSKLFNRLPDKLGMYLILLLMTFCSYELGARNITVGSGKQYSSISSAISAAKGGDTITIYAGTYKESDLQITKKLTIRGVGRPIIDGQQKKSIFEIRAAGSSISGLQVQHAGYSSMEDYAGIKIIETHHVVVSDNIVLDNYFGILFSQTVNCIAKNNTVSASQQSTEISGNAIHCWRADSITIFGNRLNGHRDGIYFEFVTNSHIEENISTHNNRYGLHFMFSHHNTYIHNTFQYNGSGVAVMYTNHVIMKHNLFLDNWGDAAYGLLLKEISDSEIYDNVFKNNTMGILSEGSSRINIVRNSFIQNGWAMRIQASSMDIKVDSNNFQSNTFDMGTNGSLVLSKFSRNYWDKYEGYDLNRDYIGDVPYRPVSLFSMITESNPIVMVLFRSLISILIDKAERIIPSLTPEDLKDDTPAMKPYQI